MSHGLCTLSRLSYAALPRYCRNYALKIYDARRNRRNAPSMARFSLPCHPWQGISVYRVHNSTVSRQLRYSLTRESVPSRSHGIKPLTLWQKRKNVMTKHHLYATINSKHFHMSPLFSSFQFHREFTTPSAVSINGRCQIILFRSCFLERIT